MIQHVAIFFCMVTLIQCESNVECRFHGNWSCTDVNNGINVNTKPKLLKNALFPNGKPPNKFFKLSNYDEEELSTTQSPLPRSTVRPAEINGTLNGDKGNETFIKDNKSFNRTVPSNITRETKTDAETLAEFGSLIGYKNPDPIINETAIDEPIKTVPVTCDLEGTNLVCRINGNASDVQIFSMEQGFNYDRLSSQRNNRERKRWRNPMDRTASRPVKDPLGLRSLRPNVPTPMPSEELENSTPRRTSNRRNNRKQSNMFY